MRKIRPLGIYLSLVLCLVPFSGLALAQSESETKAESSSEVPIVPDLITESLQNVSKGLESAVEGVGKGLEEAVDGVGKGVASFFRAINPLEAKARQLEVLVQEKQFTQANAFLIENRKYFADRYMKMPEAKEKEIRPLAQHLEDETFKPPMEQLTSHLAVIDSAKVNQQENWSEIGELYAKSNQINKLYESELVFTLLDSQPTWKTQLLQQLSRVRSLLEVEKKSIIALRHAEIFDGGDVPNNYPVIGIDVSDVHSSDEFQAHAKSRIVAIPSLEAQREVSLAKAALLSDATRKEIDKAYLQQIKTKLLADKRITLDELVSPLVKSSSPFGTEELDLSNVVKIGFIDLTPDSFKDRNVLDFKIKFKKDLPFKMEDARSAMLSSSGFESFDYLFVVDMSAAKVKRAFKNKEQIQSSMAVGERQIPNPDFTSANTAFSVSMNRLQALQIEHSRPTYCATTGECLAISVLKGIAMGGAQKEMQAAQERLNKTPQLKSEIVYQNYNYQRVAIDASKTARVDYYLIDTKAKKFHSSFFEYNDREGFNVAYDVVDSDPKKSSIEGSLQKESDVTQWEVSEPTVPLSVLFDLKNLDAKNAQKFVGIESFLQKFQNRKYEAAGVQFVNAGSPSNPRSKQTAPTASDNRVKTANASSLGVSSSSSGVIADERFDSIVLIKGPSSIGTGFYITPELILTAYHVVDKSDLVELTYYDGTKSFGKVVDHDVRLDLALVRAQTVGKPLKIHSGPIRLGSTVETIGHPKGFEFTITRGVVSALRKQQSVTLTSKNLVEFVQTDTPISPGNSGGPLMLGDAVVGVVDWVRVDKASQNLNFSVSFNEIKEYVNRFEGLVRK